MSPLVESYPHSEINKSVNNNRVLQIENNHQLKKKSWYSFETELIWTNAFFIVVLHLLCLYYTVTFPYFQRKTLCVWIFCMIMISGLGVTGGAHRFWSHRAYKAQTPLKIILAICYYSAGQNKIYAWVRDHRIHHKYTETPADPHDSNRGFWFSHVGWLMMKKRPEVIEKGKLIDMSDIENDPVVQFFDRNQAVSRVLFTLVVPVLISVYFLHQDWKYSIIAQAFLRYPWVLNITWSVNSFAHMFGDHTYNKNIRPAQNLLVCFVAAGEGAHNFHHHFPWDYKTAEFKNFVFNATTYYIDFFAQIGWAYDLKQVTPDHIKQVVERTGDGTHPVYGKYVEIKSET